MPLNFWLDNAVWMVYKILNATGGLGAEAIKINHLLLTFECALEELGTVIADMDYWISNSPPPWGILPGTYGIHSDVYGKFPRGASSWGRVNPGGGTCKSVPLVERLPSQGGMWISPDQCQFLSRTRGRYPHSLYE